MKKLLLEKPLNKITINDITEDCGVNRMTFYYHFKDIYDLVDWILAEDAAKAMEGRRGFGTWSEAYLDVLHQLQDNKTLVLNVYRSVGREQVEQYLYRLLDPILKDFADRECHDITVQDADKQFVVDFYKYALVGMTLEWTRRDMKGDPKKMVERVSTMIHGDFRRALCRLSTGSLKIEELKRFLSEVASIKFYQRARVMGFPSRRIFCLWHKNAQSSKMWSSKIRISKGSISGGKSYEYIS